MNNRISFLFDRSFVEEEDEGAESFNGLDEGEDVDNPVRKAGGKSQEQDTSRLSILWK